MLQQKTFTIEISNSIGSVSAEMMTGERVDVIMTLAHGAGAGMNHSFMVALAKALADAGIATMRFNFPYMEHGKKRPDVPAVAHKTVEVITHKSHEVFPGVPLFVSGKSFGGRMSSQYLSKHLEEFVCGIVFFGFPLHPAGKPAVDRAEHLKTINVPMLFLQGTRDELAHWNLIETVTSEIPQASLVKLESADHSFKAGKKDFIPMLVDATTKWVEKVKKK